MSRPKRVYVAVVYLLVSALGFWTGVLRHPTPLIQQHSARQWTAFFVFLFIAISPLLSLRISRWIVGPLFGVSALLGLGSMAKIDGPVTMHAIVILGSVTAITCMAAWLSYSFLFGRRIKEYLLSQKAERPNQAPEPIPPRRDG
jgi:hypothetical protein